MSDQRREIAWSRGRQQRRGKTSYAEKYAGKDNKAFVQALNLHFRQTMQKARRERGVIPIAAERPTASFQIYDDPRYLANPPNKHNDLLVLVLEEQVTSVKPRRLATKAVLDKATDGRVVGFGTTDAMGMFGYGLKRFVDVPVASPACRGKADSQDDNVRYGCAPGLELVAGRPLLERDSGGPFYVLGKNDEWLLGGATSRATDSAMHECGDGGVYVRVDRYRSWIDGVRV